VNETTWFNITVALVVGGICGLTIWLDAKDAHDVCLSGVSGLIGALVGASAAKQNHPQS
jgi:hypothetical protein